MRVPALITLIALTGCNGDTTITKQNAAPVATIEDPGASFAEGATVTFRGTVVDTDDVADDLVATWLSGADTLCAEAPVGSDGTTECEAALDLGDTEITLQGRDPDNAAGIASISLEIVASGAPSVSLLAPGEGGPYYSDYAIAIEAIVADAEDDPTALSLLFTDEDGLELDVGAVVDTDGTTSGAATFAEGAHAITLTAMDSNGKTGTATTAFVVGGPNVLPTCTIVAPADGSSVGLGQMVSLVGTVTDPDVSEDWLVGEWSSDLDGVLSTTNADVDGNVSFDTDLLSYGTHVLTLTGTDEVGGVCASSVTFDVTGPPSVVIELPTDGDLYNEGGTVDFSAIVADDSTASDALSLYWESDIDGVLDTTPADSSGIVGFSAAWLSLGTHTVTLTVTDDNGLTATASVFFTINGLPSAPSVEITPASATGDDDLVASVTADSVDPELDPISYSYAWYVGGVLSAYTLDTLPASATTRGEVWEVWVTPNDGYGDGASGSASVTIQNSAPVVSTVTLSPDPAYEGDVLSCSVGATTDADGDTVSVDLQWTVNGVTTGVSTATLDDAYWQHGDDVVCTATPSDGTINGATVASNTVTITNAIPTIASVSITPSAPEATDTLTCAAAGFADADGDTDQSTYAWTVNGVYAGSGTTLAATFTGGDMVECTVTPYDGADAGTPMSDTVTIDNTPPVLADVTLTPANPAEADILACTPGVTTDIDGTTAFSYTYTWTVNGGVIGETSSALDGSGFDKGDLIACQVTPNDGTDDGAAVASNTVTAINTAPEVTAVSIAPTSPDTDDTLVATVSTYDIDGDSVSLTYAWYVNGVHVGTSAASLAGATFVRGDVVYVEVTPGDGSASGLTVASSDVTVQNTLPAMTSVTLSPTAAYEASTLTCAASASDLDGDTLAYTYAWTVNGAAIAPTTATLTGTYFDTGDAVVCAATPSDSSGAGAAMASNTVTIANTAPTLTSATLTPTTAYEATTLTCSPGSSSDADGDVVSYTYAWYVDGALVAATSASLTGTYFDKLEDVYCRVTPNDGTSSGTAVSSNTVTVSNTAPLTSSVSLAPSAPTESSTLTCSPTSTDADGDSISYTYAWYVNSAAIASTGSTLTGTHFDSGDSIYCRATPTDGSTPGTAVDSNVVTATNTAPVVSSVTLTPTTAYEASTLTCAPTASDADGDSLSYTYAWYVDGALVAASSATLTGTYFDEGEDVYCRVTPNDGTASGTAVSSNTVTVSNTAPVLSTVAVTPTTAYESSTLTCTPTSSDADGDAVSYSYAWYVNSAAVAPTTTTLTGTYFGGGDSVYCRVTPNDGTSSGAAMNATAVTIANTAPVISSVDLTPTAPSESSTLTCSPTGSDADGDSVTYSYAWYVNSAAITPTSSTLSGTWFDSGDSIYCRATPNDGTTSGTAVTSNTVTATNTAPVVSSVTLTPSSAYEASTLTCSASATDADGDSVTYAYAWYVEGALVAPTSSTLTGTYFDRSDDVYCRVTPSDASASGSASSSNTVTIGNTAPVMSSVSLTPSSPTVASTLTCAPSATDADSDAITYTYAWYVDSALVAATTSTLTSTYFGSGDVVYCRATPTDGTTAGTAMSASSVTVSNTAPVATSAALTPTTAYEASTLTCAGTGSDADGDTLSWTYAWYVNSAVIAPTTSTLTGTYFAGGNTVYCRATPSDGTASGTAVSSNTVTISNTTPVLSAVSLTPTTAYEASTLTCAPTSSDADGDSVTYAYAWYVNSALIAPTSSTLSGTYFSRGNTVYCRVTPSDASASGTAMSSSTVTISNTAPVMSSVSLTPSSPTVASTLTCAPSASDADSDSVSYTYAWYVNSTAVAATSATLTSTYFGGGDTVYCRATPTDGTTAGTAMSSSSVTVSNTAPVATSAALTPTTAYEASTLTCAGTGSDADGDTLAWTYAWYVNSAVIAPTTSTLTGTYFASGNTVYCRATPSDGTASGTAVSSNTVTISNTTPVLSAVSLTPTTAYEASTLTCAPTSSDADGDSVTYTYAWYVNSALIAPTSSTLSGTYFSRGNTVYCRVTPSDASASGTAMSASTVTISNTAPVVSSVGLTPTSATTSSTFTCAPTASDADGDAMTYTYAWYVNGSLASGTSSTRSASGLSSGNTVYCTVTPNDGTVSGIAVTSNTATITNTAPVISSVSLTPTTAYEASTLTCAPTATDAEGDAISYTYAWYVNSTLIAPTSVTLTGTYFSSGNAVYCRATPSDGSATGTAVSSGSVTISNTAPVATATLTPTTAYEASTLTCAGSATDADGTSSFTYTYAWYVNGALIAPATATLTGTYFSKTNTVYCTVVANDGSTNSATATSSTVTISNTAPVTSSVSLTPTTAYESSTLTCTPTSTDADGDSISYTYAWYVNSAVIAPTSSTLTGTYFSKSNTVYCRATPTDGTTAGSAVSSSSRTISNSTPSAPVVTISPDAPEDADALVCGITTASTDADPADSINYTFTWTRNGTSFTGATTTTRTGDTVPAASTVENDVWVCSVTATDGTATSSSGTDTVDVLAALYAIGYDTTFATPGTGSAGANYSLGQQIVVSSAVDLEQLGTLLRLADTDSVRIALYTDSAGSPGTLVAYTALTSMSPYAAGAAIEMDVVGGPVAVSAGTYWIMMNLSGTAYMGYTTVGASSNVIKYNSLSSSSAFPASFGSASSYTGQFLNLYMLVR